MKNTLVNHLTQLLVLILQLMAGCTTLLSKQPLQTTYYTLERAESKPQLEPALNTHNKLPTLIITMPKAAPGYDTRRMMYTRAPYQLEYFARSEWIDAPAEMLRPLMISAIEKTGAFNAVLAKQNQVASDIRLESEVIKLVQDFSTKPSHVQFTLKASFVDSVNQQVIATKEFNERVNANGDNPIGGVQAANVAINLALDKLSVFSNQTMNNWLQSQEKLKKNVAN